MTIDLVNKINGFKRGRGDTNFDLTGILLGSGSSTEFSKPQVPNHAKVHTEVGYLHGRPFDHCSKWLFS